MSDLLGITLHVSKIDGELDPRVFEDTYFAINRTAKVWQALLAAGMVLEPGGGWASLLESAEKARAASPDQSVFVYKEEDAEGVQPWPAGAAPGAAQDPPPAAVAALTPRANNVVDLVPKIKIGGLVSQSRRGETMALLTRTLGVGMLASQRQGNTSHDKAWESIVDQAAYLIGDDEMAAFKVGKALRAAVPPTILAAHGAYPVEKRAYIVSLLECKGEPAEAEVRELLSGALRCQSLEKLGALLLGEERPSSIAELIKELASELCGKASPVLTAGLLAAVEAALGKHAGLCTVPGSAHEKVADVIKEHAERKTTADGLSRRSVGGGAEHGLHSKLWDTLRCVTERRKRLVTTSGLHADACKV